MKNTFYLRRNEYDANLNWHALLHYVHGYELNIIEITELGQNVEQICKAFYNIEKRRNNFSLYTILKIPRILENQYYVYVYVKFYNIEINFYYHGVNIA